MANEITVSGSISVNKPSVMSAAVARGFANTLFSMNSNYYTEGVLLAPITVAGAIPLGGVATPHWAFFYNLDPTNYFALRNGLSGADVLKFYPLEWCICPLNDAMTPYVLANTAACLFEYLIFGR